MDCDLCKKSPATVFVTDIAEVPAGEDAVERQIEDRKLCDSCAQAMDLPHAAVVMKKTVVNIWKLLQQSAQRSRQEGGLSCPDCGMTLAEFRSKGRLGCPKDYEVFRQHLDPLLYRIHNAVGHSGRLPGLDDADLARMRRVSDLRQKLETAIREEAYEHAAKLRDELQALEGDESTA